MGEPTIVLACGASKSAVTSSALELYTGPLFRDARTWALSVATRDRILVLSALHGFVPADQRLAPYNCSLQRGHRRPGSKCPACLAGLLREQLCTTPDTDERSLLARPQGPVYFIGGALYWDALVLARVPVIWLSARLPAGRITRGIGAQRAWLRAHRGLLPL